jgi:predicted AlkP superfamily phosphohydrolase/phosphomutase
MATAEKRFHVPSEEEIDKLLIDKDCINTHKSTKLSVKCFRDYLREQDPDNVEFEEFSLEHLKYVCQQYFTYMCFLGFIRYNKTFIACGFRKYENVFTHEYHIPLGRCPQGI